MLSDESEYKMKVYQTLIQHFQVDFLSKEHVDYLEKLKNEFKFYPNVCYDIGASLTHWTKNAKKIWPDSTCVLFDAFEPAEILYGEYLYHMGVLSDEDGKEVKFYQNDIWFRSNSYYRENIHFNNDYSKLFFPPENYLIKKTRTLDSIVKERNFPQPELINIDVQDAELDILKGAEETLRNTKCLIIKLQHNYKETLRNTKYLILELQHNQLNSAPLCNVTKQYLEEKGWVCLAEKFSCGKYDADYCFINFNLIK
jgi:FkbM family methyltransferase